MAMNVSIRAARVYAEALLDIANESGELARVHDDLMALRKLYDEEREFRGFFTSPRLDPDEKFRIVQKLFGDELSKPVLGLLHVMIRKGRELLLDNVADEFVRYEDQAQGKVHLHVRTARALPDDQREAMRNAIATRTGKTVEMHESVEPELIGGAIVKLGDMVIDGTLRRKLQALKKRLVAKEQMF
jgi:F-type H+-transporting ATPase subunit delta